VVVVDAKVYVADAGRVLGALSSPPPFFSRHHSEWSPKVNFSPDGERVVYTTLSDKGGKSSFSVVVDGVAGPDFDDVEIPFFSSDGKHVAYEAMTRASFKTLTPQWSMVVDGHAGGNYSGILGDSPIFTSDGALEFLAIQAGLSKDGSIYRVKYTPAP